MSAKRKTVLKGFDYMHCDDFAKYLSDMAARGWHFKEWGVGLKFEKGEPEQAEYAVEIFVKASENDMRPEPRTQEFAQYCEAAGWEFVDGKQKFCIFKKMNSTAVEMFTPEERVMNATKASLSGTAITMLVLYGINVGLRWFQLMTWFESYIFSGIFFFNIAVWTIMFVGQLLIMGYAVYKYATLKKKAHIGEKIYIGNREDGKYRFNIKDIYVVMLILLLMYYLFIMDRMSLIILNTLIIISTLVFAIILNKVRPDRDTSVGVQVVFAIVLMISIVASSMMIFADDEDSNDIATEQIPIVITDYRESDETVINATHYKESNFLGAKDSYFILGEVASIYYDVYTSKYTWTLDKIWETELKRKKSNEQRIDCTAEWNAQIAFRNSAGVYYVRYENTLLIFSDYEDINLSKEQIAIILEKLELR